MARPSGALPALRAMGFLWARACASVSPPFHAGVRVTLRARVCARAETNSVKSVLQPRWHAKLGDDTDFSESLRAELLSAGGALQRRVVTASANWQNDPRRWVRLALMIYLGVSVFVLMSILRANRRMPLMRSRPLPAPCRSQRGGD
jgi:hypothetical protein